MCSKWPPLASTQALRRVRHCFITLSIIHFSHSVMVSVGISVLGVTGLHFVNPDVRINGKYYRETLLKGELLPDMRNISEYFIFQQDNAPAHHAKETLDLLSTETPAFILPTLWLPNSPDLNPVDYKVWSVLQQQVYKVKVNNVDELRHAAYPDCLGWTWPAYYWQGRLKQWRTRLRACIQAKGGHFQLWAQTLKTSSEWSSPWMFQIL